MIMEAVSSNNLSYGVVFLVEKMIKKKKHIMVTQSYVSFRFLLKCVHFKRNDSVLGVSDFFLKSSFQMKMKDL